MCGRSTRWDALAQGRDKNTGVAAMLRRILRFLTVDCPKTDEFVHVAAARQLLTRHLLTWSSTSLPPLLPFFRSTCSRGRVNRSGTDCGIRSIGGLYDDTGNSLDLADGQLSVLKPSPFVLGDNVAVVFPWSRFSRRACCDKTSFLGSADCASELIVDDCMFPCHTFSLH